MVSYYFILAWFVWKSISSLLPQTDKEPQKYSTPRADKIDTDKHIGRVQVPLLLRLRPFIVIDIKLRIYQFDMIVTL